MIAKTVGCNLKFFGNRGGGQSDTATAPKAQAQVAAPQPAQQQVAIQQDTTHGQLKQQKKQSEKADKILTVAFGRFNPPNKGHEELFKTADRVSNGGDVKIYPSRTQDPKKNPLEPDKKISYMRKMFPKYGELIINDSDMESIFDVLRAGTNDGYGGVNIVVGADRQGETKNIVTKYNGQEYSFDMINVIPAGTADAENNSIASQMRKAAAENDYEAFKRGVPRKFGEDETEKLFKDVQKAMKVKMKEGYNLWEIAPKMDTKNLRENYIKNNIFKIGDIVEHMNTGLVGKVIRRGTNYLICVSENEVMFKPWIKDVMEYTEKKMDSIYRDKVHPNTLTGTLGAFKYAAQQTPGAIGTGKENIQVGGKAYAINFINKYKAKK